MKYTLFFTMACLSISFMACSKEEDKIEKHLSGSWTNESIEFYNNNTLVYANNDASAIWYFDQCPIKYATICTGYKKDNASGLFEEFFFQVSEDGSTLAIDKDGHYITTRDRINYKIEKISKSKLEMSLIEPDKPLEKIYLKFSK